MRKWSNGYPPCWDKCLQRMAVLQTFCVVFAALTSGEVLGIPPPPGTFQVFTFNYIKVKSNTYKLALVHCVAN